MEMMALLAGMMSMMVVSLVFQYACYKKEKAKAKK